MKFALVLVGLVVAIQYASAGCCGGCGYAAASGLGCGCGCGLEGSGESMCRGTKNCVPMVVRPQDYKPNFFTGAGVGGANSGCEGGSAGRAAAATLAAVASALSFKPVPGPCAIRKAIVKPAVLPKPVCRPPSPTYISGCDQNFAHSSCSSTQHVSGCYGPTVNGIQRGSYSLLPGSRGLDGPYNSFGPNGGDGRPCGENQANCAPADAVSLSLAYKMAQQENYNHMANEDRLNFGFRKIPREVPVKVAPQNNVPEEKIFSLNGQIVELKPVKVGSSKSLAEEAAEELLALQDEEEENNGQSGASSLRRVSLGELGYAPAKPASPAFVDIPGNVVETTIDAASSALSSVTGGSSNGGCNCCGSSPTCKVIPGNVDYKILPKLPQVCFQPPSVPDSCESVETNISEEQPSGCQISCVPVCMRKQHNSCCHKSSSSLSFHNL